MLVAIEFGSAKSRVQNISQMVKKEIDVNSGNLSRNFFHI